MKTVCSILALPFALLLAAECLARPVLPPREEKTKDEAPVPTFLEVGKTGLFINSAVLATDQKDSWRRGSFAKSFPVKMLKGRTYVIDMVSNQVDSYLRLVGPAGNQLAFDDDGGGFPNARITYRCGEDGVYQVIGTTFIPNTTGSFTLTIREP